MLDYGLSNATFESRKYVFIHKNSIGFYWKNKIRIEQDHNKKMYPKLMLSRLKVIGNSTPIYTFWAHGSKKYYFFFQPTCGPCSFMCAHVYPYVNYK